MLLKKGFLYRFRNTNGRHPFVFIEHKDWEYFIGCMLTSSPNSKFHPENITMLPEHFEVYKNGVSGEEYTLKFKNSNLVRVFLIKRTAEVNPKPCGKLTDRGLAFIDKEIIDKLPRYWHDEKNWPIF